MPKPCSWLRCRMIGLLCAGLAWLCCSSAQAAAPSAPESSPGAVAQGAAQSDAILTSFPNGVRLLVLPEPNRTLARIDTFIALPDAVRKPGVAHLVEHLMFRSSRQAPDGSLVDSLALAVGKYNAYTELGRIHLYRDVLPSRLSRALALEADRIFGLEPDPGDIELERRRILGEHAMRREWQVRSGRRDRVVAMAYSVGDSSSDLLLGERTDIATITAGDLAAFCDEALRPDRIVVLVRGPVDPKMVAACVADGFGSQAPGGAAPPVRPLPAPLPPAPCRTFKDDAQGKVLSVAFRLPGATTTDIALAHLAATIMERENGNPVLDFYGDESFLTLAVDYGKAPNAAAATENFWAETRKVLRNVQDSWMFGKRRTANVDELRELAADPVQRAEWRAERLAAGAELPEVEQLAAVVDTLSQATMAAYFSQHFVAERAYTAFFEGKDAGLPDPMFASLRWRLNPYQGTLHGHDSLPVERIAPLLATVSKLPLGRSTMVTLPNGIPVRVLEMKGESSLHLGGVRAYPFPFPGEEGADAGRLYLYLNAVNAAFNDRDAQSEPIGYELRMNTHLDASVSSLKITADGPAILAGVVGACVHKRLRCAGLNSMVYDALVEHADDWEVYFTKPPIRRATAWRFEQLFGAKHALPGWCRIRAASWGGWSRQRAEALHRQVCGTRGLTFVAVGGLDAEEVKSALSRNLGKLPVPGEPTEPDLLVPKCGVAGRVFHELTGGGAQIDVSFGGGGTAASAGLTFLDGQVIASMVTSRLRSAAADAGIDSFDVYVDMLPTQGQLLPTISVAAPARQAARVLDIIREQVATLGDRPLDEDEEARARLQMAGSTIATLEDAASARDFLLECGLLGAVPSDPLGDLCTRKPDLLAARAPLLFSRDCFAWTVVADTSHPVIGALAHPEPGGTAP